MVEHEHHWAFRAGRSHCDCGAWAPDLRCCPDLRQDGGRYPTATDLQNDFACPECHADVRARMVGGELRVICDGPEAHDVIKLGRAIHKRKRDYILARQQADAMEVIDGLPPELQKLLT